MQVSIIIKVNQAQLDIPATGIAENQFQRISYQSNNATLVQNQFNTIFIKWT